MKKITFKSLDSLSGLDLTTIAYAVAFLLGVCCKINLTLMLFIASALCVYVSFKKSKVSLTILNAVFFLYTTSNLWKFIVDTISTWWEQLIDKLWWF